MGSRRRQIKRPRTAPLMMTLIFSALLTHPTQVAVFGIFRLVPTIVGVLVGFALSVVRLLAWLDTAAASSPQLLLAGSNEIHPRLNSTGRRSASSSWWPLAWLMSIGGVIAVAASPGLPRSLALQRPVI